ncbi:MAG: hypothetical protein A3H97_18680 [Acidobacteria bacterium RIFCSPLOWO2_02_FULL_65_29]|nr:MAG: hypothetical protein A3H97_18680 [Acidobacteria bacterium RIFCSPLOWO2_02_FULL_65_29]
MSSKSALPAGFVILLISFSSLAALAADQRLIQAVRRGSMETARELIKQRIEVNAPQSDGTTALHWAVEVDNREMVSLLVGAGADVNVASDFGVTPLALASRNGSAAIVSILLRAGANVNTALRTGETPLMTAARTGRAEVVDALLEAGANLNAKEPEAGQTALMWAIAEGHTEVVRTLITHGANVREASRRGFTPLLFAARNGDVETTRALLAAGIDVNDASGDGTTALTIATIRSQVAYAKFLLDLGADPNKGPGFTPIHWVVGDWDVELAGDKTHVRPEGTEWDLTLPLKGKARLDYLTLLLDRGADVNAKAQSTPRVAVGTGGGGRGGGGRGGKTEGATAFFMAAQLADVPLMRFLLSKGADPLARTARNVSPLMAAAGVDSNTEIGYTGVAEADAVEAIKLCLELGDDVHTVSTYGENALHGAAYRGNAGSNKIAQLFLDRGVQVNVINKRGWSPVTLAEGIYTNNSNSRNPDLERLLLEHGGRPSPPGIERDAYAVIVER